MKSNALDCTPEQGDHNSTCIAIPYKGDYGALSTSERQLHIFFLRYLRIAGKGLLGVDGVIMLFSPEGRALAAFGTEEEIDALRKNGIQPGVLWKAETIGENAITTGLRTGERAISCGDENEAPLLANYTLHYCPIDVYRAVHPFDLKNCGGIGMLVLTRKHRPNDILLLDGFAHDLILNLHFRNVSNALYDRTGRGILHIDAIMDSKDVLITFCNQTLLKVLGLPSLQWQNYSYVPLKNLVDPLPQNQEFWDIVQNQKRVTDIKIILSVQGVSNQYIVSTDYYYQPKLGVKAISFFITSPLRIAHDISKKISNSAVLSFNDIIGHAPKLHGAIAKGILASSSASNVLLIGESGSGKDVFAQAIHNQSDRQKKPFVAINCAAFPRDLIASELFGYDSGAFTGARKQGNIGKFELANGGTIFLDEIGDLPLDLQATLLRVVEEKQFCRLGSNQPIRVDVKIISATNADLVEMIAQKHFRADLYYRLSTIQINIPPLRERGDDCILLAEYFFSRISDRIGRPGAVEISTEAKQLLLSLSWPGNVRELQNLMECVVQLYPQQTILPEHILDNISKYNVPRSQIPTKANTFAPAASQRQDAPSREIRHVSEEEIRQAMEYCGNNKSAAARRLGISLRTLYRKLSQ